MNKVVLVGRLTKDVDLRQSGNTNVARFTIAVDRRFKNNDGQREADFINIVAFGNSAEFVSKYFSKGMKIGVAGRIQTGSYTNKDGQKIFTVDVVGDEFEFVESKKNDAPVTNDGFANVQTDSDGFASVSEDDLELPFN